MFTPNNFYKLLVGNIFPKCVECKHYKPGIVTNGLCKIYGDIFTTRTDKTKCGINGNFFIKQTFSKLNENNLPQNK
jgi:hypothetical protein